MTHVGRYVPGSSPVHRMRVSAKVAALLVAVCLVLVADGPFGLGLAALGTAVCVRLSRVPARHALAAAWGLRWFLAVIFAMNAFLYATDGALFSLGPLHLTAAGLEQGARIVARTLLVVVLGQLLTATTRPQQLVAGVRDLLRPLARLGLNTEVAALAVGVTVQFVPTLLRECNQLVRAQAVRAGTLGINSGLTRLTDSVRLFVPVFVSAFRRADELSSAMEARGYRMGDGTATSTDRPATMLSKHQKMKEVPK